MSLTTFAVNDRVMWSTGRGCPGTVESRDGWRYPEDLERFPNDIVVKWDDGMHSLVSPGALMAAPADHGPLAAVLSDRTLAKVLSRPAHVPSGAPSLVELDRREAAERALAALVEWRKAGDVKAHIHATVALRKAADEYIAVTS